MPVVLDTYQAGIETDTFTVTEGFVLQPFSNITDWQNPPYMTHTFTSIGAIIYAGNGMSGFTIPWAQFSPNIYSQLAVYAQSGVTYPRVGIPLTRFTYDLTAYVTSPGYVPATDICTGTWVFTSGHIIIDPVATIVGAVRDGLSDFLSHISCWGWGHC